MAINNCDTQCVAFDVNGSYSMQLDDQKVRVRNAVNVFRMATTDQILYKLIVQLQCALTQIDTALVDLDNRLGGQSIMEIIADLKTQIETNRNNIATLNTNLATTNQNVSDNKGLIDTALGQLAQQAITLGSLNQQIINLSSTIGVNIPLTEVTYTGDKQYQQVIYYRVQGGTIFISGRFTTGAESSTKSLLIDLGSIPIEYAPSINMNGMDIASGVLTTSTGKANPAVATNAYIQGGSNTAIAGKVMVSLESTANLPINTEYVINITYNVPQLASRA